MQSYLSLYIELEVLPVHRVFCFTIFAKKVVFNYDKPYFEKYIFWFGIFR